MTKAVRDRLVRPGVPAPATQTGQRELHNFGVLLPASEIKPFLDYFQSDLSFRTEALYGPGLPITQVPLVGGSPPSNSLFRKGRNN